MVQQLTRRQVLQGAASLAAGYAIAPSFVFAAAADEPFDLLIKDGVVVDGSGAARFAADVAIKDGRIAKIGQLASANAKRTISAKGLVVAPGFIDMHTHSDRTLLVDGDAQSAVRQGATTHVIGNCGGSPAPVRDERAAEGRTFRTYAAFLDALRESGVSLNVCGLVGHNTVRSAVMGVVNRNPTAAELKQMQAHVAEAMQSGAVGMSTGLVSPPGAYSETREIIELARVVAEHGGVYSTHLRGEASTWVDSVREAIEIGRESGAPVQISHHKAAGRENWGSTRHTLAMIEEANAKGQTVRADVYPYRAGSAGLSQLVPPWAHEGGNGALIGRLKEPQTRMRIRRDMTVGVAGWPNFFSIDWDDIQIAGVKTAKNKRWVGKKIGDLARARGVAGVDACIDLLIEEEGAARMINFIMDENEVQRVLAHPLTMIGSDGTAVSPEIEKGQPHPRYYGCFPRVLGHYCRDQQLFSLETAIHKMTGMQAAQLGLPERGLLREGFAADIVLFNFDDVIDEATFDAPHQYPRGIETVIVNGQVVVDEGRHTGARPGEILRPRRG